MQPLRFAILGCGRMGRHHSERLREDGRGEVVALLDVLPEMALRLQQDLWPRSRLYKNVTELMCSDTIDAAILCTPTAEHFTQASQCLDRGWHVLCEKPLAMNSSESARLVRLARESGRAAGVAYNIRFYPLCHEAAARIQAGTLGDVWHITGSYVQDWLLEKTDFNWRVLAEEGGELRAIADIGTHWLDLVQFITGHRVISVCADLRTVHTSRLRPAGGAQTFTSNTGQITRNDPVAIDTEDCGSILLRFAHGANGCLWVSQTTAGRKNCLRFEIAGSRQSFSWNSETPNELWIGHRHEPNELLQRDPSLLSPSARAITNYPGGHTEGFPDTFNQLFRAFYGYIEAGDFQAKPPFPTFEDGHREVRLCEAILRSHRQQGWIALEDEPV